jgi:hypothetical protein
MYHTPKGSKDASNIILRGNRCVTTTRKVNRNIALQYKNKNRIRNLVLTTTSLYCLFLWFTTTNYQFDIFKRFSYFVVNIKLGFVFCLGPCIEVLYFIYFSVCVLKFCIFFLLIHCRKFRYFIEIVFRQSILYRRITWRFQLYKYVVVFEHL